MSFIHSTGESRRENYGYGSSKLRGFYLSGTEGMRPPCFGGEENGRERRAAVVVV